MYSSGRSQMQLPAFSIMTAHFAAPVMIFMTDLASSDSAKCRVEFFCTRFSTLSGADCTSGTKSLSTFHTMDGVYSANSASMPYTSMSFWPMTRSSARLKTRSNLSFNEPCCSITVSNCCMEVNRDSCFSFNCW